MHYKLPNDAEGDETCSASQLAKKVIENSTQGYLTLVVAAPAGGRLCFPFSRIDISATSDPSFAKLVSRLLLTVIDQLTSREETGQRTYSSCRRFAPANSRSDAHD